jgi:predicted kinase
MGALPPFFMENIMKNISIIREPFVIVLIGLPGSGKTTWVNSFLNSYRSRFEREIIHVSLDSWIEQKASERNATYSDVFNDCVGWATSKMKSQSKNAIKNENNIIWDQTNLSKKKRRGILKKVSDSYQKIAIDFDVMDNVLRERLDKRAREEGKYIPSKVMENMASSYNPITKDEGFDIIYKVR